MRKLVIFSIFAFPIITLAQTNYVLRSGTVSQGGGVSSSSQYRLTGITGITTVGKSHNSNYKLQSGMPYQAISVSIHEGPGEPLRFQFFTPYPIPMRNRVTISFVLPEESDVELSVYDISGRRVWTLRKSFSSGRHRVVWQGVDNYGQRLSSGLYILKFRAAGHLVTEKLIILR